MPPSAFSHRPHSSRLRLWAWGYRIGLWLAVPLALWKLWRRYRRQQHAVPWAQYWGYAPPLAAADAARPLVWVHAVSVGEAVAAQPLINRLQQQGYRLLLTHTTLAGRQWLRAHYPQACVCALPFDLPGCVRRFVRRTRPAVGVIMEAEYWFHLTAAAHTAGVRLVLANARLPAANARRYRAVAPLVRACVSRYDAVLAQTATDAARLRCFGARNARVAGNLKFDALLAAAPAPAPVPAIPAFAKPPIVLAATRRGEEEALLAALAAAPATARWREHPLVIAPRHPERREEILRLLARYQLRTAVRSRAQTFTAATDCYLADTLGEMHYWYVSCAVAIVGGSFLPYGGQNPFEAMHAGAVAVIGPHTANYRQFVRQAVRAGALLQAKDAAALPAILDSLLDAEATENPSRIQTAAQTFCKQQQGALARHWQAITPLLPQIPDEAP